MAVILSIETSTSVCSAALHDEGRLMEIRETHLPQSAASQLTILIDQLFSSTHTEKNALDAVAVSSGPGSYTGLRIGISTAKGICFALQRPLLVIDSLHALAGSVVSHQKESLLCPMIDARRMEVYCALLKPSMEVVTASHARVIDETSFSELLVHQNILFFGNGSEKCRSTITHPHAVFIDKIYPTAANMGALAFKKYRAGDFADLTTFEPNYLKEFVAKTKKV